MEGNGMRLSYVALAGLALAGSPVGAGELSTAGRSKIDPWVVETATVAGEAEFLVVLAEQADLSKASHLSSKEAKGSYVFQRLTKVASRTQGPVLAALRSAGVEHRPFWIANVVWVKGSLALIRELASRPDVARLSANPRVALDRPVRSAQPRGAHPQGPEPGISLIGAPAVFWARGFTGQGAVVAAGDSGQEWTHPALKPSYRGWDGSAADHNYNWHDAIHSGGGICGHDAQEPCDDDDHGTSTMGVIVGDDGLGNQIGMAPGARWIGCRNMDQGTGTPATYMECFEFFLAPTDLRGQNPRPDLAPHVVNNSWRCPDFEGCTDPNVLLPAVEALRAAGIVVVASAGNDGNDCSSMVAPPAIYDASVTVGSVNIFGEVSSFSSRGPVTVDGSNRLKPDFLAPGENVRTAVRGGQYAEFDGTSLSGPHQAGMFALMISSRPCLAGQVDAMEVHQRRHTFWFETSERCGGIPGDVIPNNTYGWGIIRAAVPEAQFCPTGGATTGLQNHSVVCKNEATGDTVSVQLAGAKSWDCEAAGLAVAAGDRVTQTVLGLGAPGSTGGAITGMDGLAARCRNVTTGKTAMIPLDGKVKWDCEEAGLVINPQDRVIEQVRGSAR
jgi:hypothetical protein